MAAMSPIGIEDVPPVDRTEATSLAATEFERFGALLRALPPETWDLPTDCTRWSVKDVAAHIVGETEAFASPREFVHQWLPAARIRREVGSPWLIDGVNELQVRDRRTASPAELVARLVAAAPRATRTRARLPRPLRAVPVVFPPPIGRRTVAYLVDLVITRDVWMHRVDIARATVNAFYQHSRIKQYLKDGRALRVETVIKDTYDLGVQRRLHNLPELQTRARAVNRRLLDTERVGQGCVLASPAVERITHPTTTVDGRRAPALRFGDPRVQALAGALSVSLLAVTGITTKSLRALMTGLLGDSAGAGYSMNRASYDLTRLRRNGLITRVPRRNLYQLTADGLAFAIFYTKVHNRVLRPLMATDRPQAPPPLRAALRTIDTHIHARLAEARLPSAAA
jgi:uncharacterized protein (TIGR03083 family)